MTAFGESKSIYEWLRDPRCAVKTYTTLQSRLFRGSDPEQAITTPALKVSGKRTENVLERNADISSVQRRKDFKRFQKASI